MLSPLGPGELRGASSRLEPPERAILDRPAAADRRFRTASGLPRDIGLLVLEYARTLATRWRGELLVSEILARLCDEDEPAFRTLCAGNRDPGRAVKEVLPPLWLQ